MNKKLILILSAAFLIGGLNLDLAAQAEIKGPFGYDLQKDMYREKSKPKKWETDSQNTSTSTDNQNGQTGTAEADTSDEAVFLSKYDTNPAYYPKATMKSAIAKYKSENYTGSLQELFAIMKKDPTNATGYYYMAMIYTKLGEKEAALGCYQRVIDLNPNDTLVNYATRGKACVNNETACNMTGDVSSASGEALDELDKFIQNTTGNGFSKELNDKLRDKQLKNIQNKMNRGIPLTEDDLKKLQEYNKSEGIKIDRLAMANDMPSNDEIINAVQVLKRAGLNISTEMPDSSSKKFKGSATSTPAKVEEIQEPQTAQVTPQQPTVQPANYYTPDPQIQQMTMMLNNGNNNNSDPMMNMLPYMMQNEGKGMDPQVIQAMMMNSMMNSLNGMNSNNNNN